MLETEKFYVIGNNLSLDFINTKIADGTKPKDLLESVEDLVSWAIVVKMVEKNDAKSHLASWTAKSENFFNEALRFRAVLHDLFSGVMLDEKVKASEINSINQLLRTQTGYAELSPNEKGFEKRFHTDFHDARQLLMSIASSAADLLCYGNLDLIKKCEGENCVLYFFDTTKNHSRRWCSMGHCGNRAKANAFYKRKKLGLNERQI